MIWIFSWPAFYNYPIAGLFVWIPIIALATCIYKRLRRVKAGNKPKAAYYRQLIWANAVMTYGGMNFMYNDLTQNSQKDQPQIILGIIAILLYASARGAQKKAEQKLTEQQSQVASNDKPSVT